MRDADAREAAIEALRMLVHDVGKYITRAARNVPEAGPVPPVLIPLLVDDLYGTRRGERASKIVADCAPLFVAWIAPNERAALEGALGRIDALEAEVRLGDPRAALEAVALAREVDRSLCEMLIALSGEGPGEDRA